jgi:hypothetical protein
MRTLQAPSPRTIGLRVAYLSLAFALACQMHAGAAQRPDQTDARVASDLQGLQRFSATHSLADLGSTVDVLSSAVDLPTIKRKDYIERRRAIVTAWSQVLRAIEQSYDPTFNPKDPNDLPALCLVPPPERSGKQLPSCADPKDVQDAQARAAYVAALKANALKAQRANYYHDLRNIDDQAMLALRLNLASFRNAGALTDTAALDGILQQVGLSAARRATIDKMF